MSLGITDRSVAVYFVNYFDKKNKVTIKPGYVYYNDENVYTFYKETQANLDPYADSGNVGGWHYKDIKFYTGAPGTSYKAAGTTIDNWVGAPFLRIYSSSDSSNTSHDKQVCIAVDNIVGEDGITGAIAINSAANKVATAEESDAITINNTYTQPIYLGMMPRLYSVYGTIKVRLYWAYMGPCMMTWEDKYGTSRGSEFAGPKNIEITNGNNRKLLVETYSSYNDALAASGLYSYDEYIESITTDRSTSNMWGKGGNFWVPDQEVYRPQDEGFFDPALYEYNTPWTDYHVFYFYDPNKKLHKRKPIEMHFPKKNSGGGGGSSSGPCLKSDTLITMADGSYKAIRDIKPGEEILGYDFEKQKPTKSIVLACQITGKHSKCTYVTFSNNQSIHMTEGHNLYSVKYGRYLPIEEFQEGDMVLDDGGQEVEILVIQKYWELKTQDQFWHLVSSNNTYFANSIMNANHAIDKFRFLHDILHQMIDDPIEELMLDEAKDAGCFSFTVTNADFVKISTKYQTIIKKATIEIDDCNREIEKLNLLIPRVFVPQQIRDQYPAELERRTQLYKRIAELKKNIQDAQNNYNNLLEGYSGLGKDIMLPDPVRREKYFKRANKIANDNFTLYQEYYPYIE